MRWRGTGLWNVSAGWRCLPPPGGAAWDLQQHLALLRLKVEAGEERREQEGRPRRVPRDGHVLGDRHARAAQHQLSILERGDGRPWLSGGHCASMHIGLMGGGGSPQPIQRSSSQKKRPLTPVFCKRRISTSITRTHFHYSLWLANLPKKKSLLLWIGGTVQSTEGGTLNRQRGTPPPLGGPGCRSRGAGAHHRGRSRRGTWGPRRWGRPAGSGREAQLHRLWGGGGVCGRWGGGAGRRE